MPELKIVHLFNFSKGSRYHQMIRFYSGSFIAFSCWFAIFLPMGHTPGDTDYSIATARAIVERRTLAIERSDQVRQPAKGADGRYYSKYGIAYALLFVPHVVCAHLMHRLLPLPAPCTVPILIQLLISFTNTIIAAVTAVLFLVLVSALGYDRRIALFTAASIVCASILLPYSKILHSEVAATAVLAVACITLIWRDSVDVRTGLALGIMAGILIALKGGYFLYAGMLGVCVLWRIARGRYTLRGIAACMGAFSAIACTLALLNWHRFGNIFDFGYGSEEGKFDTPILYGLWGLLLSPSKSIFIYCPLLVLVFFAAQALWRRHAELTFFIFAIAIANLITFAMWHDWHSGWAWGPRLLIPSLIILHLCVAEIALRARMRRWIRPALALLMLAGFAVNLLGSLIWYQQIYYFHQDYDSIAHSHPVIAARLLAHKMQSRSETYSCAEFGIDCNKGYYAGGWRSLVANDSLHLDGFEKFRGLATMWSGVSRNFGVRFLFVPPLLLLTVALGLFAALWRGCSGKNQPAPDRAKTAR